MKYAPSSFSRKAGAIPVATVFYSPIYKARRKKIAAGFILCLFKFMITDFLYMRNHTYCSYRLTVRRNR